MYCSFTNQMLKVPFLLLQHRELPLKKKLHLSVLLHIKKPGCYFHFTVLVVSNTTDHDRITTSSSLLTDMFSIKVIMEGSYSL